MGDWHTHPNGSPAMSWSDKRTLKQIATHEEAVNPKPVMLIGGGSPKNWTWSAHQFRENLLSFFVRYTSSSLRIFSA